MCLKCNFPQFWQRIVHTHTHTHAHTRSVTSHTLAHTSHTHTHTYIRTRHTHTDTHITHTHTHTHTHTRTHTHTHTHTRAFSHWKKHMPYFHLIMLPLFMTPSVVSILFEIILWSEMQCNLYKTLSYQRIAEVSTFRRINVKTPNNIVQQKEKKISSNHNNKIVLFLKAETLWRDHAWHPSLNMVTKKEM